MPENESNNNSNSNIILQTLERHDDEIKSLNERMSKNEERDAMRDKDILELRKEVRQNTTTINMLSETLGGEHGLIASSKETRDSMNRSAGFLALAGVVILTIGGWFFYLNLEDRRQAKEDRKQTIEIIKELYMLKAIVKKGE
jgi:hypothetical protein